MSLFSNGILIGHVSAWWQADFEKCSASDCSQIYRAIVAYSIIYRKTDVLQVFRTFKSMLNDNLNLCHQSECTNIFMKSQRLARIYSEKKPYINFISRKCKLALSHEVYKGVYNYQLFSIINFTRKFCYWHRLILSYLLIC